MTFMAPGQLFTFHPTSTSNSQTVAISMLNFSCCREFYHHQET